MLAEIRALDEGRSLIRIPPETDVPVTPRVLRLLETPPFRRLQHISQLGLVSQVYPGATHSRFEHSLGVYRLSLLYLKSLSNDPRFLSLVDERSQSLFLVCALLHDIGHWPFCHAIEDMRLPNVPRHEWLAKRLLATSELQHCLETDWQFSSKDIADFLTGEITHPAHRILSNMLSGPIDIDKLDYLDRDSLHAGVPYGRNFDRQRLIQALCVGEAGNELAITEKGKTAAEMMVFARYIMFSEVYWHHAVRSATAMLQRAVFDLPNHAPLEEWMQWQDREVTEALRQTTRGTASEPLIEGIFGAHRRLFKRVAQFHSHEHPQLHQALARRPFAELVLYSHRLAELASRQLGTSIPPTAILIDAPPVKLEVQFKVQVRQGDGSYLAMGEVSPVVRALALQQFDDVVKRVRVFVSPEYRDPFRKLDIPELIASAANL